MCTNEFQYCNLSRLSPQDTKNYLNGYKPIMVHQYYFLLYCLQLFGWFPNKEILHCISQCRRLHTKSHSNTLLNTTTGQTKYISSFYVFCHYQALSPHSIYFVTTRNYLLILFILSPSIIISSCYLFCYHQELSPLSIYFVITRNYLLSLFILSPSGIISSFYIFFHHQELSPLAIVFV